MKRLISLCLSIMIVMLSLSIEINAQEIDPFDISNFDSSELDLTEIIMEDLMAMTSEEYSEIIKEFERVYDPFNSYDKEVSNGELTINLNSLDGIKNDNEVNPTWISGDYDIDTGEYTEEGTHEAITGAACDILNNDRGFFSNNTGTEVLIVLYIGLGSLLPDKDENDWIFAKHFYHPLDMDNYLGSKEETARNYSQIHYDTAVNYAQEGNMTKAYEHLGRCLHYIQDLNVPHHASNVTAANPLKGHVQFEEFAGNNFDLFMSTYNTIGVNNYDYYPVQYDVGTLAHLAAYYANRRIDFVNDILDKSEWHNQARIGLRNAARYSVMVMYKFANESAVPFFPN